MYACIKTNQYQQWITHRSSESDPITIRSSSSNFQISPRRAPCAVRQFGLGSPQETGLSGQLPTCGSELSADLGQGAQLLELVVVTPCV